MEDLICLLATVRTLKLVHGLVQKEIPAYKQIVKTPVLNNCKNNISIKSYNAKLYL